MRERSPRSLVGLKEKPPLIIPDSVDRMLHEDRRYNAAAIGAWGGIMLHVSYHAMLADRDIGMIFLNAASIFAMGAFTRDIVRIAIREDIDQNQPK